jgi:hypothetical protein
MKVQIFVEASAFIAALGLACLLPGTAYAQFEPSPDFFELSTTVPPAAQHTQTAANASLGDFHGTFFVALRRGVQWPQPEIRAVHTVGKVGWGEPNGDNARWDRGDEHPRSPGPCKFENGPECIADAEVRR